MLSITDLQFKYDGNSILNGLNLEVEKGELIGIVGPNGSGKTTFLRLISGVLSPDFGSIKLCELDNHHLKPSQRAKLLAVVPQNGRPPLNFSVQDIVFMGRNPYRKFLRSETEHDIDAVNWAMRVTNISHLATRNLASISGGEIQRTLVAMALAQKTPVLLMDEPTSSLDLAYQTDIMEILRGLCQEHEVSILVATHDLILAARYCNHLVMLAGEDGYIQGSPSQVLTSENIHRVYGTEAHVIEHPVEGVPIVLPVSNREGRNLKSRNI